MEDNQRFYFEDSQYLENDHGVDTRTLAAKIKSGKLTSGTRAFLMSVFLDEKGGIESINDEYICIRSVLNPAYHHIIMSYDVIDPWGEVKTCGVMEISNSMGIERLMLDGREVLRYIASVHHYHGESHILPKEQRIAIYDALTAMYLDYSAPRYMGICSALSMVVHDMGLEREERDLDPYDFVTHWPELVAIKPHDAFTGCYWWNNGNDEVRLEAIKKMKELAIAAKE
jgi:hypothetical protein